ncbi:hypothetical protein LTR62_000986 [Meristemomyces frigidus]|uniref:RRM domain-containing protein n=1 Tax=Meristemomyces frigidus TaxID=1508187 RepID=A0AAN7YC03_9PEZI|nr:hypothetical protein LTR62_000986 [Meristemomyces frigidus]
MSMEDDGEIPPNATVYVRGINERVNVSKVVDTLKELFGEYGTILDVIAKKSIKRKGQAFVIYDSVDSAQYAIDELQGFEVFGNQILVEFAKTRSDVTVLREDGEAGLDKHKEHRLAEKDRKQAIEAAEAAEAAKVAKRSAADGLAERPAKNPKAGNADNVVPDEYLPPNKTLMLKDLPDDYDEDALGVVFGRFPGFREVRVVRFKKIAFVEYEGEEGAVMAKEATNGMMLGEQAIVVTYLRA